MNTRQLVLIALLVVLQGCGFQLRGLASLPDNLSQLRLISGNLTTQQQRDLVRSLEKADASLHSDNTKKPIILRVRINTLPEIDLADSIGSGQNIIRLSRELVFSVTGAAGEAMVVDKTIRQSTDLELDDSNLLGTEDERRQALEALDTSLFNSLMIQLRRL